ncbi:MAG TPA: DUF262 domain-containing protein [Planctomycetaceae bacterium]|nr:DUF262 domain-containing protein [Planctomycetaceae bacterium]
MELEAQLGLTKTVFRVIDFLNWQRHGHLELRPPFQRESVWSQKAKSFFIDTIIRGYPIPIVFLQDRTDLRTGEATRRVIDGQQRLRTVLAFVDPGCLGDDLRDEDHFLISRAHNPSLAGKRFAELSDNIQERILNFEFSVHILPSTTPTAVLLEIFARMNATGVKANEQELRNARYHGEFKQFCYRYAYEHTDQWLKWRLFDRKQLARMKEVEFTSELVLALLNGPGGKSQVAIDRAYKTYDDAFPHADEARRHLDSVIEQIEGAFSASLNARYGRSLASTPYRTQGWFYPLFVVIHRALFGSMTIGGSTKKPKRLNPARLRQVLEERAHQLTGQLESGEIEPGLLKALRGAATDRQSRQTRIEFLMQGKGFGD